MLDLQLRNGMVPSLLRKWPTGVAWLLMPRFDALHARKLCNLDLYQSIQSLPVIQSPSWIAIKLPYPIVTLDVKIVETLIGESPPDPNESSPHPVIRLSKGQSKKIGLYRRFEAILSVSHFLDQAFDLLLGIVVTNWG
jgi:hypothetical protein